MRTSPPTGFFAGLLSLPSPLSAWNDGFSNCGWKYPGKLFPPGPRLSRLFGEGLVDAPEGALRGRL